MTEKAQSELQRISERDVAARERLQEDTRAQVAALRNELEDRMVATYQEFKRVEERLVQSVGARLEAMEPQSERFKRVLEDARGAALFVRTTFNLEFVRSGEVVPQQSFGTAFFVSEQGLALAARHVLFPWHHDRELQVLVALGLVSVHEETVAWSLWTTDEQVIAGGDPSSEPLFDAATAWSSNSESRGRAPFVLSAHHLHGGVGGGTRRCGHDPRTRIRGRRCCRTPDHEVRCAGGESRPRRGDG